MAGPQETRREFEARLIVHAWKDARFAEELRRDPKAVIARELAVKQPGRAVPPNLTIRVYEETPGVIYLRVPCKPAAAETLSETQLAQIAAGTPQSGGYGAPPPGPQNDGYTLADEQLRKIAGGRTGSGGGDGSPPPGPVNDGY